MDAESQPKKKGNRTNNPIVFSAALNPGIDGLMVVAMGLDGILVDPAKAAASECKCYASDKHIDALCFTKGIIGALDEQQKMLYCANPEKVEHLPVPKSLQRRWESFGEASKECEKGKTNPVSGTRIADLEDRFICMTDLAKKGKEQMVMA